VDATIKKILPLKRGNGTDYFRVIFETEAGRMLKTDLCPRFRNWKNWERVLKVGNRLGDLELKDFLGSTSQKILTVDADQSPVLLQEAEKPTETQGELF